MSTELFKFKKKRFNRTMTKPIEVYSTGENHLPAFRILISEFCC